MHNLTRQAAKQMKHSCTAQACHVAHSGTGSVGLEALSRGAAAAHFVELDPWVSSNVLQDNIAACSRQAESTVFGGRAENFLQRVTASTATAPAAYDFVRCERHLAFCFCMIRQKRTALHAVHRPQRLQHVSSCWGRWRKDTPECMTLLSQGSPCTEILEST